MYVHLPTSQKYAKRFGNRVSVWEETAFETSSGLRKEDLKENRRGRVVSKRRSSLMLQRYKKFGGLRRERSERSEQEEEKKEERSEPSE